MSTGASHFSGPDWVATPPDNPRPAQPQARPGTAYQGFQAWSPAALLMGLALIVLSGIGHVVSWLYVSLAPGNMTDVDTRLGLTISIIYTIIILALAIFAVIAAVLGVREARRLNFARGIALAGMFASIVGLLCWLMSSTNLLITAIARLR